MSFKKYLCLLGSVLVSIICFGQATEETNRLQNDIGFFINTAQGLPSLEYRVGLNERDKLRIGLDYGIETNGFSGAGEILSASDSSVLRRYKLIQNIRPSLRIGIDRKLSIKYLSLGLDVQFTYTNRTVDYFQTNTILNEQGNWVLEGPSLTTTSSTPNTNSVKYHFLMPSLRGNIMAEFPLGNSFVFSTYFAGFFGPNVFIDETNRNDPNGEIPRPSDLTFELNSFFGIGVRYLIPRK